MPGFDDLSAREEEEESQVFGIVVDEDVLAFRSGAGRSGICCSYVGAARSHTESGSDLCAFLFGRREHDGRRGKESCKKQFHRPFSLR
jgi:hypothetical protein